MSTSAVLEMMRRAAVIPVIVIDDPAHAVPMAEALVAGGLEVLEITLRTPAALDAIRAIANAVPGALPGVGTVTSTEQMIAARAAGACFAVSPGLTPKLAAAAQRSGLPLLPGTMTPGDIVLAQELGYSALKFFPAVPAGGIGMLKAFAGPFPDLRFCPTGGITIDNASEFLALPNVVCVGGSWLTPKALMAKGDWAGIEALARAAAALPRPGLVSS